MKKDDLAALAVGLATGIIAEEEISKQFGDSILTDVLAFAGGGVVGSIAGGVTKAVMKNEIVDEVTSALTFGLFD